MSYDDFINIALDAAVLAGEKIMEVYNASEHIDFESMFSNQSLKMVGNHCKRIYYLHQSILVHKSIILSASFSAMTSVYMSLSRSTVSSSALRRLLRTMPVVSP